MFGTNNQVLEKENAAIERRRKMEEERKARIFDPKSRTKGVDPEALERQIREKKEAEERERNRDIAFAQEAENNERLLQGLLNQRETEKREATKQVSNYNQTVSPKSFRKEWELSDPSVTMSPLDPNEVGFSGLRTFQGEDREAANRKKKQAEQMRDWIAQQTKEKTERVKREKQIQSMYDERLNEIDRMLLELQEAHNRSKIQEARAEKEYNLQQAESKKLREAQEKLEDSMRGLQSIEFATTGSPFLTENRNAVHNGKIIPYEFKGMSTEQLKEIQASQKRQQELLQLKRERENLEKAKWDTLALTQEQLIEERLKALELLKKEEQLKLLEQNRTLAESQKDKNRNLAQQYSSNVPSEDFFSQFNTSAR